MQIKLKWVNRNVLPTKTRIYRTTAIVPNDQLGTALVELDGSVTEWVDTTAARGITYYYVFGVVGDGTTYYSQPLKIEAIYNTGPGPTKLVQGDQELGYFGQVASIDFFTAADMQAFSGLDAWQPVTPLPLWNKWCRNGKILFIPKSPLNVSSAYLAFYEKGLVFGTDDNGPFVPPGAVPTNQRRVITKGANRFIVRFPTGVDDRNNPGRVVPDDAGPEIRAFSEIADLFYPSINLCIPPAQRFPRLLLSTGSDSAGIANGARNVLAQEKYKTGWNAGLPITFSDKVTQSALKQVAFSPDVGGWRPVLELIQTDFVIGSIIL